MEVFMSAIELTAYSGAILGPIAKVLGWVMSGIYDFVLKISGGRVNSITLAIILMTLLIYLCLLPLTIKQQKFSKLSQEMQPEMNAIREKYQGRSDQESMMKMNEETQLLYQKYGIRRYGFHGTSHRYVSKRACDILGVPYENQKIITAHVGNGGSIAAVMNGKCVDTSMGLTPTEGLLMGTRCGDIDPGAIPFIMEKEGLDAAGLSNLFNKQSGVAGLVGGSSDMRDLEAAVAQGDERASMTLDVYNYRIKKYIGAYAAAMGGCDILVWTGGVGENQWETRRVVCQDMEYMGMKIDVEKNHGMRGEEMVISTPDSKVTIMVVPTDEEYMIASDTLDILQSK